MNDLGDLMLLLDDHLVTSDGQINEMDNPGSFNQSTLSRFGNYTNRSGINPSESGENKIIDYDYDYEQALKTFYWGELIPPLIVYSTIFILGVIGNFLIIYTIARFRRLKSTTNVFLSSLASADLLVILICIPVKLARLFSYTWTLGGFTCKTVYYVQSVSTICSVLTLTIMSIERYYAIVYPMQAKYQCTIFKAKKISALTWLLSFFLSSPTIFVQIHMQVGWRRVAYWCVRNFDSTVAWPLYETYMLVLILILPASVMAVAYSSIYHTVCKMAIARRRMTSYKSNALTTFASDQSRQRNDHETSEYRQVVTMLMVIVILFIVCWAPILILNVIKSYVVSKKYSRTLRNLATGADLLSYCNSCINPIVYGFMSRNFRESFRQTLCCKKLRRRDSLSRQISLSATRVSMIRRTDSTSNGWNGRNSLSCRYTNNTLIPSNSMAMNETPASTSDQAARYSRRTSPSYANCKL